MPIFEYVPDSDETCPYCHGGFEEIQGMHDDPLTECPECGGACHRILSTFGVTGKLNALLSPSNLAEKGFTQYKRKGKGYYEKTAGQGPMGISDGS